MLALLALVGAVSGVAPALAHGPPAAPLGAASEYGFLNRELFDLDCPEPQHMALQLDNPLCACLLSVPRLLPRPCLRWAHLERRRNMAS